MDDKFFRLYRSTPDRRRVMFVWRYSPRLKVEPLSLVAFCVFNPFTAEYSSFLFTESYKYDLRRELSSFVNHVCSYEQFSRVAKASADSFCSLLKRINFPEFDDTFIDRLF